jgi:hypothetical protein
MRFRVSRRSLVRLGAATALGVTLGAAASFGAPAIGPESPVDGRIHFNVSGGLATLQRLAAQGVTFGGGALPKATCTSTGNPAADIQLKCDNLTSPEDETPIVVDPTDPNHLLAGSNDYYLVPTGHPPGSSTDRLLRGVRRRRHLDRRADPDGLRNRFRER